MKLTNIGGRAVPYLEVLLREPLLQTHVWRPGGEEADEEPQHRDEGGDEEVCQEGPLASEHAQCGPPQLGALQAGAGTDACGGKCTLR